ncbi:MAG: hypothetical protein LQ347_002683 [Umbilicaria vellea]|nr:MAG: hypothetical protein LQ347_002683 [Umbilicaria vellea]
MENVQGKEGIYASSDQFNEGRVTVHDLGLTLLPGSQIETKGEHQVEAAAPCEQNVVCGEEQENGAVPDASTTAGEAQRTFGLATGINVQPGDLAARSVRLHAVLGRHTLKRKGHNGRKGTAETTHSSEEDDESLENKKARPGANWTSKRVLLPQKRRRITRDVTSSAGVVESSDSQVLSRMKSASRVGSLFQRSALSGIVTGTQLAANRNARKSAACMPALQPLTLPLASSRQSKSTSFYVSDSITDSEDTTSTSEPELKIYAEIQRVALAQKTSRIFKSQPERYFRPTGSFSRSPIVEDRQIYSHQVNSAITGSERRYRNHHPRPALVKALDPADPTLCRVSAASRLQRPSHSARGLNSASNPSLEQFQNRSPNLTNLARETSSASQSLRRRAYSTSDIPTTKEACRTPLSSRLRKASGITTSTSSTDISFGKGNSTFLRPRARSTSSAMSFNHGYSDEFQGSANPYAVTDSTLDTNLVPPGSAYELTPLTSLHSFCIPNRGVEPSILIFTSYWYPAF